MECTIEIEKLGLSMFSNAEIGYYYKYKTKSFTEEELLEASHLSIEELCNMLYKKDTLDRSGYAIHIKDLHIFDELKKLYNYSHKVDTRSYMPIWEKPKKMMWCKDWCEDKGINGEDLILIPCTPEEIQRIANKEQTVLVRKNILKGMI